MAQSKALEIAQKRALKIPWWRMYKLTAYAINLVIANIETYSHDDSKSHSFSSDGHKFGGMAHSHGNSLGTPFSRTPLLYSISLVRCYFAAAAVVVSGSARQL